MTNTSSYDKAGNLASLTNAGGTVGYSYDAIDRVKTITQSDGAVSIYTYNILGLGSQTNSGTTTYCDREPDGRPFGQRTGTSKQFFLTDRLGSTTWEVGGRRCGAGRLGSGAGRGHGSGGGWWA